MKRLLAGVLGMLCVGCLGLAQAAGNPEAGKEKAASCGGCHGPAGVSSSPVNPNLAGQKEMALVNAMMAYKTGQRNHGAMRALLAPFSPQDIEDIAAFYASQPCK